MVKMMLAGGESRAESCKSSPDERESSVAVECARSPE